MPFEQRRDARADVADHRRDDLDVGVHLLRLDVDLDELLRLRAPGLALAVRQQPVEARADQHDDVGLRQHGRARRARALRMRVGQQALAHAHRQERHAALLDELADRIVGLRVGRALAEDDQRALGALEHVERALDRVRRRNLRGRRHRSPSPATSCPSRHPSPGRTAWPADRDRRRPDGPTPRRGSRARGRCRCRRRAARGTPPCRAAWRWRAGPSPRSRPAAGRRSRARTSPRSGSSGSSWWWRGRARSGR